MVSSDIEPTNIVALVHSEAVVAFATPDLQTD
jgi:hypothetical protein